VSTSMGYVTHRVIFPGLDRERERGSTCRHSNKILFRFPPATALGPTCQTWGSWGNKKRTLSHGDMGTHLSRAMLARLAKLVLKLGWVACGSSVRAVANRCWKLMGGIYRSYVYTLIIQTGLFWRDI
jgi:hypothetical protein